MISFKPFSKKTVSVPKTLQAFSVDKNINIKSIDFTLEGYETLIRRKGVSEDLIIEDPASIDQAMMLNKDARIYQRYEITIFSSELDTNAYEISLAYNKQKTKVIATIKAGTVFSTDNNLAKNLKDTIYHKKLSLGCLIGIFEEKLEQQLKKLLEILPYGKKLSKDIRFTVAQGIEPIECVNSEIEKTYLEAKENTRNYIDGVHKGELVLRYKKHKDATAGRTCEGKYIEPNKPIILKIPQIDETITTQENDQYIDFYANDNGYVSYENNFLCISKTLKLESATFKTTGDIDAGELNDEVSVAIEHSQGTHEDGISSGVKIDVKTLNSNGTIGANVEVLACDLHLDAQTHKHSSLAVKNTAKIKLHRGELFANEAEIDILETGRVTAYESVHVKKMIGGEIIAPKVYIDELVSNGKITASELIDVTSISGDHNILIIDPSKIENYHTVKKELTDQIEAKKMLYKEEQKNLEARIKDHAEQLDRIKTFQQRIAEAKTYGKTPMKQDILRIKEYKRKSEELKQKQEELSSEKHEINKLEDALLQLLDQDLYAQIKTNSLHNGHSKVVFVNPKNAKEVVTIPTGRIETISLELDKDGQRVIKTTP